MKDVVPGEGDTAKTQSLFSTDTHEVDEILQKPDEVVIIRQGVLSKRIQGSTIHWAERILKLTPDAILFGTDLDEVRDHIKLLDISDIWVWCIDDGSKVKGESVFDEEDRRDIQNIISADLSAMEKVPVSVDSEQVSTHVGLSAQVDGEHFSQMEWKNVFSIHLSKYGRTYHLRGISYDDTSEWLHFIKEARRSAVRKYTAALGLTTNQKLQIFVRTVFANRWFQYLLSCILLFNFILNIIQCETPESTHSSHYFDDIDFALTIIYMLELVFNMYGHWFWPFFTNMWSVFDFIIILFSVVDIILTSVASDVNANITVIRLLRIFRIFRVMGKLNSLNCVVVAVTDSLWSVANVFFIFWMILSIYAIIGTSIYSESHPNLFKKFSTSSFTMFQVATGDGWSEIVRAMSRDLTKSDDEIDTGVALYLISYTLFVGIVVMNVVVAILLNGIVDSLASAETERIRQSELKEHHKVSGPMDPLLSTLAHFTSAGHLTSQIEMLFELLDVDDSGEVSYEEFKVGIKQMKYTPAINISIEDWHDFTDYGQLADKDDSFSKESFTVAIKRQLINYSQRLLAHRMKEMTRRDPDTASILFAFKISMMQLFQLHTDLSGKANLALQHDDVKSANTASEGLVAGKGKLPSTVKVLGSDSGHVDMKMTSGILKKRGHVNTSWKHRLYHLDFCA